MSLSFSNLVTEAVGTGLLCFTVSSVVSQGSDLAYLAIGTTLMAAVYAGGHVSGGMYNPAVALAVLIRGSMDWLAFPFYIIAQAAGAAGGGLLSKYMFGSIGCPTMTGTLYPSIACEAIITFALCHTVLHTATVPANSNSYYGLAIGFTVLSGAISVGGVSGGAFNPAVAALTYLAGKLTMDHIILYSAGPMGGALIAGILFRITNPRECAPRPPPSPPGKRGAAKPPVFYNPDWGAFVVEFVGTFMLCFTVTQAASSAAAAWSIGGILMCQVYAGANVSGANYNPAVTIGLWLRFKLQGNRAMPTSKAIGYIISQCAGAAAASYGTAYLGLSTGAPACASPMAIPNLLAEVIGTFFLVYVVLQAATADKIISEGKEFFGIAIGLTVTSMAVTVGGLSGGAFNPAVGLLGILQDPKTLVLYTAGPVGGAVIAAIAFRITNAYEFGSRGFLEMS